MEFSSYATIIAFFAPFILFFNQSKAFIIKIFRILWKKKTIPQDLKLYFYSFLLEQSNPINFSDYFLDPTTFALWSKSKQRYLGVVIKRYDLEVFFYKKIIPIFISSNKISSMNVSFLLFTFPFEKILSQCLQTWHNNLDKIEKSLQHFNIVEMKGTGLKMGIGIDKPTYSNPPTSPSSSETPQLRLPILWTDDLVTLKRQSLIGLDINDFEYSQPIISSPYIFTIKGKFVFEQVSTWLSAEQWYNTRNIVWKRGILLNGKPGNGKSSLIKEIARQLNMKLYIFDLTSMDNNEFSNKIQDMIYGAAIVLFEDIDVVFNQRENLQKTQQSTGITFDYFINKLDGVNSITNKFIFITTNHMENLDNSLLRPGRIDEILQIDPLTQEERRIMATNILSPYTEEILEILDLGKNDSTAEFQNRCIQKSLKLFWKEKK